jgi:hypothetical protein
MTGSRALRSNASAGASIRAAGFVVAPIPEEYRASVALTHRDRGVNQVLTTGLTSFQRRVSRAE